MKKLKYLALVPVFGTVILMLYLFIKWVKKEINNKFHLYLASCVIFGFLSFIVIYLFLVFLNNVFHINHFFQNYGFFIVVIFGGYLMNLFSFVLVYRKWDDLKK